MWVGYLAIQTRAARTSHALYLNRHLSAELSDCLSHLQGHKLHRSSSDTYSKSVCFNCWLGSCWSLVKPTPTLCWLLVRHLNSNTRSCNPLNDSCCSQMQHSCMCTHLNYSPGIPFIPFHGIKFGASSCNTEARIFLDTGCRLVFYSALVVNFPRDWSMFVL